MPDCQHCKTPTTLYLCTSCTTTLANHYDNLAGTPATTSTPATTGLIEHLHTAASTPLHTTDDTQTHTQPTSTPPPGNPDALNTLKEIHQHLADTAAALPVTDPITTPPHKTVPADFIGPLQRGWRRGTSHYQPTTRELALWLAAHTHTITTQNTAGHTLTTTQHLINKATQTIDKPPPILFQNPCPTCQTTLTARTQQHTITCPTCQTTHTITTLAQPGIQHLIQQGHCWTADLLPAVLSLAGTPISTRSLRRWRQHGHLPIRGWQTTNGHINPTPHSPYDQPVYRPADICSHTNTHRVTFGHKTG